MGNRGENIYWSFSSGTFSIPTANILGAVNAWFNEVVDYSSTLIPNFSDCYTSAGKAIGHYTQVVWAQTKSIACGTSVCKDNSV